MTSLADRLTEATGIEFNQVSDITAHAGDPYSDYFIAATTHAGGVLEVTVAGEMTRYLAVSEERMAEILHEVGIA